MNPQSKLHTQIHKKNMAALKIRLELAIQFLQEFNLLNSTPILRLINKFQCQIRKANQFQRDIKILKIL